MGGRLARSVQSYGCGSGEASSTMRSAGCSSFQRSTISSVLMPMLALLFTLPVKAPGTFSAEVMNALVHTYVHAQVALGVDGGAKDGDTGMDRASFLEQAD